MAWRSVNRKLVNVSVENQRTAPVHGVSRTLPHSKVSVPGEENMNRAKEWVDENEK